VRRLLLILLLLLPLSCASAPDEAALAALASFDEAWRIIHESYWDPAMGGLDWEGVRDELRPGLAAKPSLEASRDAIRAMIARLGQSHFALIPRGGASRGAGVSGALHATGIAIAFSADGLLVSGVEGASAAALAGIEPGCLITRMGGHDSRALMAWAKGAEPAPEDLRFLPIGNRIWVVGSEPFAIEYVDASGRQISAEIHPEPYSGDLGSLFALAAGPMEFEAKALAGGVGYLRLSLFADPVRIMPEFEAAIARFAGAPGIILDLRGNPGGYGAMAGNMGGFFVAERAYLGTQRTRQGTVKYVLQPRKNSYQGPLAILIDSGSASTSEILASGLKALGRARVFGERSMGAALPSLLATLPSGDILQYAVADYVSASGERLEGKGVEPDVAAPHSREALLKGVDAGLDAAMRWIMGASTAIGTETHDRP
jgi:carboxyl-terminal processing protease